MAKKYKVVLTAVLILVVLLSVYGYLSLWKEKEYLLDNLNYIRKQITSLENDKKGLIQSLEKEKEIQQKLIEQNSKMQADLKAGEERLAKLDTELIRAQKVIEELNSQLSAIKSENVSLAEEKTNLDTQLVQVAQEKETMRVRLSSLTELKKAIAELKKSMRSVGRTIKQKIILRTEDILVGNRGFIIKDGKSTFPAKVKIEVKPLPAND